MSLSYDSAEDAVPDQETTFNRFDSLIRQLIARRPSDPSLISRNSEEIIIDKEVDGVRYLLLRLPKPARVAVSLSPREQEIVRMVAKGHPNKIIADVLSISSWTVGTHLRRIFARLGVGSRAAMVARLLEERRAWEQLQTRDSPSPSGTPIERKSRSAQNGASASSQSVGRRDSVSHRAG
jgi:DNA-binding CsgD family transcriptional regulator